MFKSIYRWLAKADPPASADLLFVLAGQQNRKEYATELFKQDLALHVLFSVGRFEIRRFVNLDLPQTIDLLKLAQNIPPRERHFFVHFTCEEFDVQRIPATGLGTLREIEALTDWLKAHPEISSMLVVSTGPHLRRLRMCCRVLLTRDLEIRFLAVPEENPFVEEQHWWSAGTVRKSVLSELVKLACYSVLLPLWKSARRKQSGTSGPSHS